MAAVTAPARVYAVQINGAKSGAPNRALLPAVHTQTQVAAPACTKQNHKHDGANPNVEEMLNPRTIVDTFAAFLPIRSSTWTCGIPPGKGMMEADTRLRYRRSRWATWATESSQLAVVISSGICGQAQNDRNWQGFFVFKDQEKMIL